MKYDALTMTYGNVTENDEDKICILSDLRRFIDHGLGSKIEKFVDSMEDFFQKNDYITIDQYNTLVFIYKKHNVEEFLTKNHEY
jgi:hypothetical protein